MIAAASRGTKKRGTQPGKEGHHALARLLCSSLSHTGSNELQTALEGRTVTRGGGDGGRRRVDDGRRTDNGGGRRPEEDGRRTRRGWPDGRRRAARAEIRPPTGRIQLWKGRIWPEEPAATAMAEKVGRGRDGGARTGTRRPRRARTRERRRRLLLLNEGGAENGRTACWTGGGARRRRPAGTKGWLLLLLRRRIRDGRM